MAAAAAAVGPRWKQDAFGIGIRLAAIACDRFDRTYFLRKALERALASNSPVSAAMRCLSAARVQHAILTHRLSLKGRVAPHELAVAGAGAGDPAAAAFPAP